MKSSKLTQVFSFIIFLSVIFFALFGAKQVTAESSPDVTIYLFWGDGCPHCAAAKPFLEQMAASNPSIHLLKYEIYNDSDNLALLKKVSLAFGFTATKVPTIFIGDQYWEGYSDVIEKEIEDAIKSNLATGSTDMVAAILAGEDLSFPGKSKITPLIIVLAVAMLLVGGIAFSSRQKPAKLQKK